MLINHLGLVHIESKKCPNPTNFSQIWLKTQYFDSSLWVRGTFLTPCVRALNKKIHVCDVFRLNRPHLFSFWKSRTRRNVWRLGEFSIEGTFFLRSPAVVGDQNEIDSDIKLALIQPDPIPSTFTHWAVGKRRKDSFYYYILFPFPDPSIQFGSLFFFFI